ncbi:MAG: hypothetical protein Q4D41_04195 [Prevotellaceae bacterium]|nr:hypothetical protein [Prevotellaceae bacterium]
MRRFKLLQKNYTGSVGLRRQGDCGERNNGIYRNKYPNITLFIGYFGTNTIKLENFFK